MVRTDFPTLTPRIRRTCLFAILNEERKTAYLEFKNGPSYALPGLARYRVNVFRQRGHVGAVLRLIPIRVKKMM